MGATSDLASGGTRLCCGDPRTGTAKPIRSVSTRVCGMPDSLKDDAYPVGSGSPIFGSGSPICSAPAWAVAWADIGRAARHSRDGCPTPLLPYIDGPESTG